MIYFWQAGVDKQSVVHELKQTVTGDDNESDDKSQSKTPDYQGDSQSHYFNFWYITRLKCINILQNPAWYNIEKCTISNLIPTAK